MHLRRFSTPILRRAWIPYFILLFTLLLSVLATVFFANETKQNDALSFQNLEERTQDTLGNQMNNYITLLQGTTGLFASSESVTGSEFKTYVDRLHLTEQYPGIRSLGYIIVVPAAQKDMLTAQMQAEGQPDFSIRPATNLPEVSAIVYLEPATAQNSASLGLDMFSVPVRREAMEKARDTARPALTGKSTPIRKNSGVTSPLFLVFVPYYQGGIAPKTVAERRETFSGFVYGAFISANLFKGILHGEKSPQIDFQVFDGTTTDPRNLLHDSRSTAMQQDRAYHPRFTQVHQLHIAERTWTIRYFSNKAFDQTSDVGLMPFILIFGIITSGVLFFLSRSQYQAGRKAEISEANMHYLSEASRILSSSLDYKKTLMSVAQLGVPHIADWCLVDLKVDDRVQHLAVAHKDPRKVKWGKQYQKLHPVNLSGREGVAKVFRTGKSELIPVITDQMLVSTINDKNELKLIRGLGFTSMMMVPLKVRNSTTGVITYISANPNRHFSKADLATAQEIAGRAALSIEHARLYAESQQAVKIRDDFISVASHELKTPVTSLKMYLQVLERRFIKEKDERISNAFSRMDSQVDKLTLLISDLLNVSRLQLGRLEFNSEHFDLMDTIEEVVESIQPTSKKHTIETAGSVKKQVYGDKYRVSQVLTNLLTNAIKYSPEANRVLVTLSDEKDFARVSVRDFGIGIAEKHLQKIFNRFYRVTDTNEKTFPGLGIGLFISYEIIERHGGKMTVESKKGEGSTFSFTLPYKRVSTKR